MLLFVLTGCVPEPEQTTPVPWGDSQVSSLAATARDPRRMWLTVYPSDRGPQFQGANRNHPGQTADRRFRSRDKSSLPIIMVDGFQHDGVPAVIDTTAQDCWASTWAASRLSLIPLGRPLYRQRAYHIDHDIPGYLSAAPRLKIDKLGVETVLFVWHAAEGPLGALDRDPEHHQAKAVLGYPFLRSFAFVQFDFPARRMFFSTTIGYLPNTKRVLATAPILEARGALATRGMLDGERSLIVLDTAGAFGLVWEGHPEKVSHLALGDMVFRQVTPEPGPSMRAGAEHLPRVGRGLLDRYRITLDHQTNTIYFELPSDMEPS